jgi:hypothetical protein
MNPTQTVAAPQSSPPRLELKDLLEIHKTLGEEMRHTATVMWQFSVAILTLQGGAIALSGTDNFQSVLGKVVIVAAFVLSVAFSVMLLRQAFERSCFAKRIRNAEKELQTELQKITTSPNLPSLFVEITSPALISWFTSIWLAAILVVESLLGLAVFVAYLCGYFG